MNLQFEQPFEYRQPTRQRQLLGSDPYVTAEEITIASVTPSATAVPPDSQVPVEVVVQAGGSEIPPPASMVNTNAPDDCSQGRLLRADIVGANLFVRVSSAVSDTSDPRCYNLNTRFGTTGGRTYTEVLTATTPPDTGVLPIEVELVGAKSGTVYDSKTVEVNVSSTASPPPQDGGVGLITIGGGGGDDGNGDGDGDPLDIPGIDFPFVSDLEGSLAVLVLILLLLFIVSANL
jgi:hypothetical protein